MFNIIGAALCILAVIFIAIKVTEESWVRALKILGVVLLIVGLVAMAVGLLVSLI